MFKIQLYKIYLLHKINLKIFQLKEFFKYIKNA